MDELAALGLLAERLDVGDDAAVVEDLVLTTDMLHERRDFPAGTTRYTAGWRAVGASLSDVAAMGADATAALAVYGAPTFDEAALVAFVDGASDVCEAVDADYVGGDLDDHDEFTVATTAVGRTEAPLWRLGASPGEVVCVTGTLGRSAAALALFEQGDIERANDLFRFTPRVAAGRALAPYAGACIDSSDGLARSAHQLASASDVGIALETPLPIDDVVGETAANDAERREQGVFFGEDFELVVTLPEENVEELRAAIDVEVSVVGEVIEDDGVTLNGDPLPNRGYTHGEG